MSVEKLKELRVCEKKAVKLMRFFGIPLLISVLSTLLHIIIPGEESNPITIGIHMLLIIILMVITSHFGFKEMKYVSQEEAMIISILEQFLQSKGMCEESFEIIWNELTHEYMVAFHNQTINYDDLTKQVQALIHELNKIANKNVKVRLL